MDISDSVLKAYLSNVFWIGGGTCGGKTTITDMLAEKHGFVPYHAEHRGREHFALASEADHPAMSREIPILMSRREEDILGRSVKEVVPACEAMHDEQHEMVVLDVIKLSKDRHVVVDTSADPRMLKRIAGDGRLVCLYADEPTVRMTCNGRDSRMAEVFATYSRPDEVREHTMQVGFQHGLRDRTRAEEAGLVCLDRADTKSAEDMLAKVEAQFGL
jgi:hypothetical protein